MAIMPRKKQNAAHHSLKHPMALLEAHTGEPQRPGERPRSNRRILPVIRKFSVGNEPLRR
jgi:hypothetical protein